MVPEAKGLDSDSLKRYYWVYLLNPYVKSYAVYKCPSNPSSFIPGDAAKITFNAPGAKGTNYGGQNSYGHNDAWMSPAGNYAVGGQPKSVTQASIQRVSSTILIADGAYYGLVPDVQNDSTFAGAYSNSYNGAEKQYVLDQGGQYVNYWKNIGNANWSAQGGTLAATDAANLAKGRHSEIINCVFADGHAKAYNYKRVIGDICLWTTDADGAHPNCN